MSNLADDILNFYFRVRGEHPSEAVDAFWFVFLLVLLFSLLSHSDVNQNVSYSL